MMTHREIVEMRMPTALRAYPAMTTIGKRVDQIIDETLRLRQALWDIALLAGADGDGNDSPAALTSDIVAFAVDAVEGMRADYHVERGRVGL